MTLAGFLLAVFFCNLADEIGRRPILALAWLGEILYFGWYFTASYYYNSFPPAAILISSLFLCVGGGGRVVTTCLLAMLTDTAPESYTVAFLSWHGTSYAAMGLLASVVARSLMGLGLVAPFIFSLVTALAGFGIMFLAPETLLHDRASEFDGVTSHGPEEPPDSAMQDPSGASAPPNTRHCDTTLSSNTSPASTPLLGGHHSHRGTDEHDWRDFVSWNLLVCFMAVFLKRVSFASEDFIYQYASRSLQVDLRETTSLQMTNSLGALVATGEQLPSVNGFLAKNAEFAGTRMMPLWGTRAGALTLIVGNIVMSLAQTPVSLAMGFTIAGLGECLEPSLQSLARSFIHAGAAARVFGLIAVVDTCAFFVSGPMMAAFFSLGQHLGGKWTALIFFVSVALFSIVFGLTFLFRRHRPT